MARIEGQIWITQTKPHRLKFFADGVEYTVLADNSFICHGPVKKGMLLAVDTFDGLNELIVRPAHWPEDAGSVIGLAASNAADGQTVTITNMGQMEFTETELQDCFITRSDLFSDLADQAGQEFAIGTNATTAGFGKTTGTYGDGSSGNGWNDNASKNGRGASVYWFIGRSVLENPAVPVLAYKDPSNDIYYGSDNAKKSNRGYGQLTFATPSGHPVVGTKPFSKDELDMSYIGLPSVGTVADYELTGGVITSLTLNVNVVPFTPKVEFKFPTNSLFALDADPKTVTLHTGLLTTDKEVDLDFSCMLSDTPNYVGNKEIVIPSFNYDTTAHTATFVFTGTGTSSYVRIKGSVSYCEDLPS